MFKTRNKGNTYEHSLNHSLEFFSKAGSLFEKRKSYYCTDDHNGASLFGEKSGDSINEETALSLFQKTWIVDKEISFKLLLWLRDCRGGAGNRSGFRSCLIWLATHDPKWIKTNIKLIPEIGRWDDLSSLYDTPCETEALELWTAAIKTAQPGSLACKWADRRDNKLRKFLKLDPKSYRKLLVKGTQVVENKMCSNLWYQIEYKHVPSMAMAGYTNAFKKHDSERFNKFKEAVTSGNETINATVLFPHNCVRTAKNGDPEIADLQFAALPNYMVDSNKRILCLCDSSHSMSIKVSGSTHAIDISTGLSLYCSDRLSKDNPFHRKFIQFTSESRISDWNGMKFSEVILDKTGLFNHAVGSTNIQKALDTILGFAKLYKARSDQIPNVLMIISDMQFDSGITSLNKTEIEASLDKWSEAGYEIPAIIYWNTAGYLGSPATIDILNVSLVSGFTPAILTAIFSGNDISPNAILMRALEKYKIIVPSE